MPVNGHGFVAFLAFRAGALGQHVLGPVIHTALTFRSFAPFKTAPVNSFTSAAFGPFGTVPLLTPVGSAKSWLGTSLRAAFLIIAVALVAGLPLLIAITLRTALPLLIRTGMCSAGLAMIGPLSPVMAIRLITGGAIISGRFLFRYAVGRVKIRSSAIDDQLVGLFVACCRRLFTMRLPASVFIPSAVPVPVAVAIPVAI
jgi:hypothetical protein